MRQNRGVPSHILFDFFGTLVAYSPRDPDHDFRRSHQLLRDMGGMLGYADYRAYWSTVHSRFDSAAYRTGREFAMTDVIAEFLRLTLCRQPTPDETDAMTKTHLADWDSCVRHLPGLADVLAELSSRYRFAVVSNTNDTDLVPAHLDAMGVRHYFDAVILSVSTGWCKPHPRIFLAALSELGIEASDAVFVGDSYRRDYEGPTKAGMRSYLIDPRKTTKAPEHARLSSIFDLPAALAALPEDSKK